MSNANLPKALIMPFEKNQEVIIPAGAKYTLLDYNTHGEVATEGSMSVELIGYYPQEFNLEDSLWQKIEPVTSLVFLGEDEAIRIVELSEAICEANDEEVRYYS